MQNRFSEFLENNRIPEGFSNIFEDSSPKVFFWQVIRIFDFLSLSADSRYLQSEPLNNFHLNGHNSIFNPEIQKLE